MIYEIVGQSEFSLSLDRGEFMKTDLITCIYEFGTQRFYEICRNNSYQQGLVNLPVLVDNIEFPNFKEELDV
jgi:hypothetical protein